MLDLLMFEMPGMGMRNIDRVESSSQRWIDIRAGRIAHHPAVLLVNAQLAHDLMVDGNIFFWHDDHLPEEPLDSRPFDLELLFFDVSFCKQDKVVARSQVVDSLLDSIKELQGMGTNLFSEAANLLDILVLKVPFCKATIGFDQAPGKIGRSIAHEALYIVQDSAHLRRDFLRRVYLPREKDVQATVRDAVAGGAN